MKFFKIFLIILSSLIFAEIGYATTYYICQSATGNGSGDSYANCESVGNHNSDTFAPGDIIYLCDTITSQVAPPSSGNADTTEGRIFYRGDYAGHAGVLSGVSVAADTGAFNLSAKSYITLDSATIQNTVGGSAVKVRAGSPASAYGITIRNSYLTGSAQDGIYSDADGGYEIDNLIVEFNDITGNKMSGHLSGGVKTRADIRYNNFDGNGTYVGAPYCVYHDTGAMYYHNIYVGHTQNGGTHYIYGNRLVNCLCGQGIKIKNNADIYHNFIANNAGYDVMHIEYSGVTATQRVWANVIITGLGISAITACPESNGTLTVYDYNNSIYVNSSWDHSWTSGIILDSLTASGVDSFTAKNNIFYVNHSDNACYYKSATGTPGSTTIENNLCYGPTSNVAYWAGGYRTWTYWQNTLGFDSPVGYNEDPKYTNPSGNDLTLQVTSPCIDTGENLGSTFQVGLDPSTTWTLQNPGIVQSSVVTVTRPRGAAWDIGAYEYLQTLPALTGVTNFIGGTMK